MITYTRALPTNAPLSTRPDSNAGTTVMITHTNLDLFEESEELAAERWYSSSRGIDVATSPTIVPLFGDREYVKARFRMLRRLPANHDNDGAAAADPDSVDAAIAFINRMEVHPDFYATLTDSGLAVIEFENRDEGMFAGVTFKAPNIIECYCRRRGRESIIFEGEIERQDTKELLTECIGVAY